MEFLVFIGLLVVAWIVIGFILSVLRSSRYINGLASISDMMDNHEYKGSDIYNKRVKHIEDVGLATVLAEIIDEARYMAITHINMNPKHFTGSAIKNAENQYMMRYATAHGQGDEFQSIMRVGKEMQDIINK